MGFGIPVPAGMKERFPHEQLNFRGILQRLGTIHEQLIALSNCLHLPVDVTQDRIGPE
jgi:hypothetical protein